MGTPGGAGGSVRESVLRRVGRRRCLRWLDGRDRRRLRPAERFPIVGRPRNRQRHGEGTE